jgi:hypothetical protein
MGIELDEVRAGVRTAMRGAACLALALSLVVTMGGTTSTARGEEGGSGEAPAASDSTEITVVEQITASTVVGDSVVTASDEPDSLSSQDVHPQDSPESGGFVLSTRDGRAAMRIYGSIRLHGIYDFNGLQANNAFAPYDIPVGEGNSADPRFTMNAQQSRFGFEVLRVLEDGDVNIRIEADFIDFNAPHARLRLRHAYGKYRNWLGGQTWSTFADVLALPLTVDFEGPNSAVSLRTAQIRYTWLVEDELWLAAAIETPDADVATTDSTETTYQNFPDLVGRTRKKGDWGHFQVAGILRNIAYRDSEGEQKYQPGYGAVVSGNVELTSRMETHYQAVYGSAISRFINGLNGRGLDMIENPNTGDLDGVESMGGYIAVDYEWRPKTSFGAVGGLTNIVNEEYQPSDAFNNSQYLAINAFHEVSQGARFGLEYLWGQRVNKNREKGSANRLQFMMYYDF